MPNGHLLVVTGPSHSGKTALIRELRGLLRPPTARLGVDDVVETLEFGPASDKWREGIPVAYDVVAASAAELLSHGFLVMLESTFTYVPWEGTNGSFHADQLERLKAIAREAGAGFALVRLDVPVAELLRRRDQTGRLSPAVIEGIARLFDAAVPDDAALTLSGSGRTPEELARAVLEAYPALGESLRTAR
jgi:chloramphenicol 3-O-phosphotransferase